MSVAGSVTCRPQYKPNIHDPTAHSPGTPSHMGSLGDPMPTIWRAAQVVETHSAKTNSTPQRTSAVSGPPPSSLPVNESQEKIPSSIPKRNTKTREEEAEVIDALAQLGDTILLPADVLAPSGSNRLPHPPLLPKNPSAPADSSQDCLPIFQISYKILTK